MYEIIIKQKGSIIKICGNDWEIVDQEPVCDDADARLKNVYGYTPEIKKEVPCDEEIFRQTVKELDLATVIKAINRL